MDVDMQDPSTNPRPRDEADNSKPKGGVNGKKVAYYYDHDVGNFNYGLGHPMKPHRIRMAHNLVTNYGLLDKMDVFRPTRANPDQMTRFHSDEYVDFLEKVSPETVEELTGSGSRFLTGEDCPAFEGLFEFCSISAGGSICAAERLNSGAADIAVNWAGGLHHAKKREASGFCYVNDIVLGILELLRYHPRVLYVDIDVHHGDGVEEAFYSTDRVMTASFHKFGDFFPGTGDARDTGVGKGKDYAVNVPLRDGITDETYASIFEPVIQHIMDWFRPGAIVLQCGADSLSGDKLGTFNLSMKGHSDCVKFVQSFGVPMMVVGGGGYTTKNVARTWTYETGLVLGEDLNENLPYNDYLEYYGPRFKLEVLENNMENQNTPEYLNNLKSRVIDTLRSMPFAPSVGMQEVPGISLGRAVGVLGPDDDSEDDSDLDVQINQRLKQITASTARAADDSESNSEDDSSRRSRSRVPRSSSRRISASPFPQSSSHHHQNGSYSHSRASSSKPQPPSHLQNPYYPSSSSTNDISSSINRPSTILDPSSASAFNGPIDFFAGASELAGGGAAGGRKKRTFFSIGEGRGAGGGSGGFRRNGGIGVEEGVYRGMAQGVYSGF